MIDSLPKLSTYLAQQLAVAMAAALPSSSAWRFTGSVAELVPDDFDAVRVVVSIDSATAETSVSALNCVRATVQLEAFFDPAAPGMSSPAAAPGLIRGWSAVLAATWRELLSSLAGQSLTDPSDNIAAVYVVAVYHDRLEVSTDNPYYTAAAPASLILQF